MYVWNQDNVDQLPEVMRSIVCGSLDRLSNIKILRLSDAIVTITDRTYSELFLPFDPAVLETVAEETTTSRMQITKSVAEPSGSKPVHSR